MCLICERIQMIKEHKNPYFVKELEELKEKLQRELDALL